MGVINTEMMNKYVVEQGRENVAYLIGLVAYVESGLNDRALRFEHNVYLLNRYIRKGDIQAFRREYEYYISKNTVRALFSFSWGILQIMGFNLWRKRVRYDLDVSAKSFIFDAMDLLNQGRYFLGFLIDNRLSAKKIIEEMESIGVGKQTLKLAKRWNGRSEYAETLIKAFRNIEGDMAEKEDVLKTGEKILMWALDIQDEAF